MATFDEILARIAKNRKAHDAADRLLYEAKLGLPKSADKLDAAAVRAKLIEDFEACDQAWESLQKSVTELHALGTAKELVKNWDDRLPILLFPVRLETRYVTLPDRKRQLWVRIFPDDILVHSHEKTLTEQEDAAGRAYWSALWKADRPEQPQPADAQPTPDDLKRAAWKTLTAQFGVRRSLWVARQTLPDNWAAHDTLSGADKLGFPKRITKTHEWTRAPRTKAMPDRFELRVQLGGGASVLKMTGNLIPDTLHLGPDPFRAEQAFRKTEEAVEFDESFDWLTRFDRAVEVGLGFKVDLPASGTLPNIQKIAVLGLLHSASAEESAHLLESLLEAHHFSEGLSLVPQGTPTNNTENDDSGYAPNEDFIEKGWWEPAEKPLFTTQPGCDGHRLATALGVAPAALEELRHAGIRDFEEASLVNQALYPATAGFYLDILLHPAIPEQYLAKTRDFFTRFVAGRGPLPAVRVGDQPYGILPTSSIEGWKVPSMPADSTEEKFLKKMHEVLTTLLSNLEGSVGKVKQVGQAGDPAAIFLEILRLQPSSVQFRQRIGNLREMFDGNTALINNPDFKNKAQLQRQLATAFLAFRGYSGSTLLSELLYPISKTTLIQASNLLERKPHSKTDPLAPVGDTGKNYVEWLAAAGSLDTLEKQDFGESSPGKKTPPPDSLFYLLLRHSFLLEMLHDAEQLAGAANMKVSRKAFFKTFFNIEKNSRDLTFWEFLRSEIPFSILGFSGKVPLADLVFALQTPGISAMRNTLAPLAKIPTARLERCVAEHLDLCSHRLDAWETGLFQHRLHHNRLAPGMSGGIYLGAFGWLENLQATPRTTLAASAVPAALHPPDGKPLFKPANSGGFHHAPSLQQASAAALLAAGYRQHATPNNPGPFAVNLSSERIRRATTLLEGVRDGQPIEALLGYQIERALHERTRFNLPANVLVAPLRRNFPIENQYVPQEGETPGAAQERIRSRSVTDGLRFVQVFADENMVRGFVSKVRQESAFPPPLFNAFVALLKEIRQDLENTLDALKDLYVAESAYQAVRGNTDRNAAVLGALENALQMPDPEVIRTPRGAQLHLTNRVTLHFENAAPNSSPWSGIAMTPRARTEPGLNKWLAGALGNPAKIGCVAARLDETGTAQAPATIQLSKLKIQALDFVQLADDGAGAFSGEMENRVALAYRTAKQLPPDVPVKVFFGQTTGTAAFSFEKIRPLAAALKKTLTGANPLHAGHFAPASNGETPADPNYNLAELTSRIETGVGLLFKTLTNIAAIAPNSKTPKNDDNPATVGRLFDLAKADAATDIDPAERLRQVPFIKEARESLFKFRVELAHFALDGALPPAPFLDSAETEVVQMFGLWQNADALRARATALLTMAKNAPDSQTAHEICIRASKDLFGEAFLLLPKFSYHNSADIAQSHADRPQLLRFFSEKSKMPAALVPETWIHTAARVRPRLHVWETVRTLAELAGGQQLSLLPVQLPYRAQDSWLAVEFPGTDPATGQPFNPPVQTVSCIAQGETAFATGEKQSGILLDEWQEVAPVGKETTGISFHYDAPNAVAPNVLLLAISPTQTGKWNWEALFDILDSTYKRMKRRALEPRHLAENPVLAALLPMTVAPINTLSQGPSLDFAFANPEFLKYAKANQLGGGGLIFTGH